MKPIQNLSRLLAEMSPHLDPKPYVFITLPGGAYGDLAEAKPIASFQEPEGLSLIIPKVEADRRDLSYDAAFKAITLRVHSSLEAVGLTAAVAAALAEANISANVVAATLHDHVFVPADQAPTALRLLKNLSRSFLD